MADRIRNPKALENGDRVRIKYKMNMAGKPGAADCWTKGWTGEYLTTENVGHGRQLRIKRDRDGEHVHVSPQAEDIKLYREG